MALRSLAVKLKALPLRVPQFRAFITKPKDDPRDKVVAKIENAYIYGSNEEFYHAIGPMMEKELKSFEEKLQRQIWSLRGLAVLISAGSFGSLGYIRARL